MLAISIQSGVLPSSMLNTLWLPVMTSLMRIGPPE